MRSLLAIAALFVLSPFILALLIKVQALEFRVRELLDD